MGTSQVAVTRFRLGARRTQQLRAENALIQALASPVGCTLSRW